MKRIVISQTDPVYNDGISTAELRFQNVELGEILLSPFQKLELNSSKCTATIHRTTIIKDLGITFGHYSFQITFIQLSTRRTKYKVYGFIVWVYETFKNIHFIKFRFFSYFRSRLNTALLFEVRILSIARYRSSLISKVPIVRKNLSGAGWSLLVSYKKP